MRKLTPKKINLTGKSRLVSLFGVVMMLISAFLTSPALTMAASSPTSTLTSLVTVQPQQSSEILVNPDKGWVLYGQPSDHSSAAIAYASTGYLRFYWRDIEPKDGVFDWTSIDSAIQAWSSQGKKTAFGIMCADTFSDDPYVTPKWVYTAGAKAQTFKLTDSSLGVPGTKIIPAWNDAIFKQKIQGLIKAMGQRYDGDSRLAFVDVRSYGNWGEGHNYPYGGIDLTTTELQEQLTWHKQAFTRTQIVVPWGATKYSTTYDWAVNNKFGIRRDGILDPEPSTSVSDAVSRAIGKAPVVFEFVSSYQDMVNDGSWNATTLRQNVQDGKPSYMSMGMWDQDSSAFLKAQSGLVKEFANKMGYYFTIQQAKYPTSLGLGTNKDTLQITWLNQGLTPRYATTKVALALINQQGQVQARTWLTSQPQTWQPNTPVTEQLSFNFGTQPAGQYRLAIGLFSDSTLASPNIKLALQNHTSDNWYFLK